MEIKARKKKALRKKSVIFLLLALSFLNISIATIVFQDNLKDFEKIEIVFNSDVKGDKKITLNLSPFNFSYIFIGAYEDSPDSLKMNIISHDLDINISIILEKTVSTEPMTGTPSYYYNNEEYSFYNPTNSEIEYSLKILSNENCSYGIKIVHNYRNMGTIYYFIIMLTFFIMSFSVILISRLLNKDLGRVINIKYINITILFNSLLWIIYSIYLLSITLIFT